MDAGYGAEEQATRKARRLAQLRREQEAQGTVDAAVEEQIARAQADVRRWSQGAEGERMVADTLRMLGRYGWTAVHDVHWPGRPKANIDHIAIGPAGVMVIDAKNWTGHVDVRDGELRQNGYRRTDQVAAAAEAAGAVAALLRPEHRSAVAAVLCLASHDREPEQLGVGTLLVGRHQLAPALVAMPQRLAVSEVAAIEAHLRAVLGGQRSPELLTTAALDRPPRQRSRAGSPSPRASRGPATSMSGRSPSRSSRSGRSRRGPSVGARLLTLMVVLTGFLLGLPHLVGWFTEALTAAVTP